MVRISRLVAVLAIAIVVVCGPEVPSVASAGGSTFSGTVTDADGVPLEGIVVTVASSGYSTQATSAADGTYTTDPAPEGAYTVSFAQVDGPEPRRTLQYWPKVWSSSQATEVIIEAGTGPITGIDAFLELPASIGGTVRDAEGAVVSGACVTAWLVEGDTRHYLFDQAVDVDGTYLLASLPPSWISLELRDCVAPVELLPRTLEPVALEPGQVLGGVDAVLERGASIGGTVRDESGAPLPDVCVSAEAVDPIGDWSETVTTDAEGAYVLRGLAAGVYEVELVPCADQPLLPDLLTGVRVQAGESQGGVDTVLRAATTISGTVRDERGEPVDEVCVQASDADSVRGSDQTDEDGTYRVDMDGGGPVTLQFVDCSDTPGLAGAVTSVDLVGGEQRAGVDTVLVPGAPASVSGRVTNVRGEPLVGVCVAVYLAHESVSFTITGADGSFRSPQVGSGTWAIAYLTCPQDDGPDVDPAVLDPASGVRWQPQWWGGAALAFDDGSGDPDPVAAGADLLTLEPGDDAVIDHCFGCGALQVDMVLDGTTVRAEARVDTLALAGVSTDDAATARVSSADTATVGWQYSLTCVADATASMASVSSAVSSSSSTLVLDGVDSAREQRCRVAATLDGLLVADSEVQVLGAAAVRQSEPDAGGQGGTGAGRPIVFVG